MSSMHAAVKRLVAATEARSDAHRQAVALHAQGRAESQPPAGQHAPSGPAFPLPTQGQDDRGTHPESH